MPLTARYSVPIGAYVRRLRERRELGVSELALTSGASEQSIRDVEADRGRPRIDTLARIARGLDISLRSLLPPPEQPEPWEEVALRLDLSYADALHLRSALDRDGAAPTADRERALDTWMRERYGLPDGPEKIRLTWQASRRPRASPR